MTETAVTYQAGQSVAQWRCGRCGHVLGDIIDGRCTPLHTVVLSYGAPTVVVCPVCHSNQRWYSGWDKRQGEARRGRGMTDLMDLLKNVIEGYACRYVWNDSGPYPDVEAFIREPGTLVTMIFETPVGVLEAQQWFTKSVPPEQRAAVEPIARRSAIRRILSDPEIIKRLQAA